MRQRYLRHRLPWIAVEETDLRSQGDPETVVLLPKCGALVGLHIKSGDGRARLEQHIMLGIREDDQGQPVSCAITNELEIDTSIPAQSNPRRHTDTED